MYTWLCAHLQQHAAWAAPGAAAAASCAPKCNEELCHLAQRVHARASRCDQEHLVQDGRQLLRLRGARRSERLADDLLCLRRR